MTILDTIAAKRDGRENTTEQLQALARGAADKSIPDYQLAAWLMAAFLNPLNPRETADLTLAMAASGERLDLSSIPSPHLDKHSTGGVGDKTTLVVLPILAACGVTMVKMSGRGLGITGGTIDKLESIPGFRTDLTPEEMVDQAKRMGIALSGQTPRLAPADGALYALRDVTGTVANIPLITASILSKKIAGGAETVVLDVKCGSGAFMKTLPEAEALARSLVDTGKLCGLKISAVITDMDQPLGMAVGNAMEVQEALDVLQPSSYEDLVSSRDQTRPGTSRLAELCTALAGHALELLGKGSRIEAVEAITTGKAQHKFLCWIEAQGGIVNDLGERELLEGTCQQDVVYQGIGGWVYGVDAGVIGTVVVALGGGRKSKADKIDPSVGVTVFKIVGSRVKHGELVFRVTARTAAQAVEVAEMLEAAIVVNGEPVRATDPVLKVLK